MNFIAVLVASGLINIQQPVLDQQAVNTINHEQYSRLAVSFIKSQYVDADLIQSAEQIPFDGTHYRVYLAFTSEMTTIDHCIIHIKASQPKPNIEQITCMDYNTKLGFKEKVNYAR